MLLRFLKSLLHLGKTSQQSTAKKRSALESWDLGGTPKSNDDYHCSLKKKPFGETLKISSCDEYFSQWPTNHEHHEPLVLNQSEIHFLGLPVPNRYIIWSSPPSEKSPVNLPLSSSLLVVNLPLWSRLSSLLIKHSRKSHRFSQRTKSPWLGHRDFPASHFSSLGAILHLYTASAPIFP